MILIRFAIGLLGVGLSPMLNAANPVALSPIEQAPIFGIGPMGIAGQPPAAENHLRELVKQPHARERLVKVLRTSTTEEGRMYALLGLKQVDPKEFQQRSKAYATKTNAVSVSIGGCLVSQQAVSNVVAEIKSGHYRLNADPAQKQAPPPSSKK
jgi:hypothetical protein